MSPDINRRATTKNLDSDNAAEMAVDLVIGLSKVIADPAGVHRILHRWRDRLGNDFNTIAVIALRDVFAEYLHPTPTDQVPADSWHFDNQGTTDRE
ncbi:hypothetical protein [Nocardioides jishulii]|uniref:Uncharacterized protein n=1 Tax=Nocardioides jishulii TaxID=2575440 RepID=A0A4U2YI38_9ACTN|nr:hypothetical protein [Nocardioides jishulii]QCX28082.1 hypothetical protein FCL41_11555 [Nocardioides jishulii]TKI60746.1 hypothetical protein FC770_14630 [Nocardioides jishulii]